VAVYVLPATAAATVVEPASSSGHRASQQLDGEVTASASVVSRDRFGVAVPAPRARLRTAATPGDYVVDNDGAIRWPFTTAVAVSSPFGPRIAPCRGCSTFHNGTDFATGLGSPIYSTAAGIVTASELSGELGQHVAIAHMVNGMSFTSIYGHMEPGSSPLRVGQALQEGAIVGLTGSSGLSTGPHLFFEITIDGRPVDSFAWLVANTAH
jgi:murein DD-endopeptidase MepM/ murein hydrolase activator NlpD